jgi:H/ACA ribonucleoprotein complex subunit 2
LLATHSLHATRYSTMAEEDDGGYDEKVKYVSVIAKPLASRKSTKKLHKLVKKASQAKFVKRGVKEVVKAIRKGEKGFCIIAGDISPVDVITHLPIMCEDRDIPYIYVPSKLDLGAAACTKRPTSCILVNPGKNFEEMDLYEKLTAEARSVAVL